MDKFKVSQWLLVACWLGLQGAAGLKVDVNLERLLARRSKAQVESLNQPSFNLQLAANLQPLNLQPSTFYRHSGGTSLPTSNPQPSTTLLTKSISCPADVETLIPLLLRDLPGYATRVMRRSRRPTSTSENPIYFVLAGRPEFEPLTLGPGQYTTPTPTADLEPPQQVFFTTLERQYRDGKASYRQLYHWLFLAKTTDGWRLAMMFSRIGSSAAGRPPTPPEESSQGVVGQAVKTWLRDCRVGAIRELRNRAGGAGERESGGAGE